MKKNVDGTVVLTARQDQVLQAKWDGHTSQEIAKDLGISAKGVEFHWQRTKKKFRTNNFMQVMKAAMRQGLIEL